VFFVWALAATIVLTLLTLDVDWDYLLANTRDVFEDLENSWQATGSEAPDDGYIWELDMDAPIVSIKLTATKVDDDDDDYDDSNSYLAPNETLVDSSVSAHHESTVELNRNPEVTSTNLTTANFKSWLQENEMSFVDMYAPWCVWCQRLAPTWEKFAEEVQRLEMPIGVGKVDCIAEADLCRTEKVMAFPTLRWYHNSEPMSPDYKMDRTVQALTGFARRKLEMDTKFKEWEKKADEQLFGGEEQEDVFAVE
jgi:thiol-disulfide isomerase/thioredoxin